jgi:hypothetical protein
MKLTLEERKAKKAYKKMHKQHKKELKKLVKVDAEWDWGFLHDLVITKIRHMYEYYKAGNNVWQSDETLLPTIAELKHVLELEEELDNLFKDIPAPEATFNKDGTLTLSSTPEHDTAWDKAYKREDEIYKEIYTYIGEHLRGWWD